MRIVQKYGGTSVGDVPRIEAVAQRIKATYDKGHQVAVVVSARAGMTNELLKRARAVNPEPNERELDVLLSIGEQETIALMAMALHALGVPAVSCTGSQAGIRTDVAHTRARITDIEADALRPSLEARSVVVVAGFQGVTANGHTTTLGRGGSDLSAVALAAVLKADLCQIYTDVDGVYTADPRLVSHARKIPHIAYEEMLELAACGSRVMQARAVEFAQKYKVPFEVRSSFNHNAGTMVKDRVRSMEDVVVTGVALAPHQVKVTVSGLPDQPGSAAKVFQALGESDVIVDMIVQNIGHKGRANLTFTVDRDAATRAEKAARRAAEALGGGTAFCTGEVAKLSVVGVGMRSHSGVAATLFKALAEAGVNIQIIATSEIKIEVAIDADQAVRALRIVHAAFELGDDSAA